MPMPNSSFRLGPEPDRSRRRRLALWLGFGAWTVLALAALYFLLRSAGQHGGAPFVVQQGDSKAFAERARDWFRLAHVNFSRIYPWLLLGPYVAWLGWAFSLERGRWRVSLPVHLAACAAFAVASHALNSQVSQTVASVVLINVQHQSTLAPAPSELRTFHLEVSRQVDGAFREEYASNFEPGAIRRSSTNAVLVPPHDPLANPALTNLFSELKQAVAAPLAPPALFAFRPLSTLLDVFAYGAVVGLAHAVHFYRRYRERELCALSLESNLAKARLGALQAQLQPHFLFNTLNAIATLLRRDPRAAEATVLSLSDLLRLTLSRAESQESTMRDELQVALRYFDIQKTRFGDRLHLELEVEPATMGCLVPTLLLQPLVENAIRHGIEPSDHPGHVWVRARRQDQTLVVTVEDDGLGLPAAPGAGPGRSSEASPVPGGAPRAAAEGLGGGIGLANLRARLDALYGSGQKLELSARPAGGARVRLELPWHEAAAGPAAASPGAP